jgi:glycosyltransferase involved in cell wall biosynthesis
LKKILFLAHHRLDRAPGQRYRFEQYFDYFKENNIACELAYLLSEEDDKIMYEKGKIFNKVFIGLKAYRKRFFKLRKLNDYDLVIIFREVIPTRSIFFEKMISRFDIPIIFDFDDAIWIKDVSNVNKKLAWFKNEKKIEQILPLCTHVTCGNKYLQDFAKKFNSNVSIIPSTVDTNHYVPIKRKGDNKVRIGWVGSHTTIKHFEKILNVLKKIKEKYKETVEFIVIGDENYSNKELEIKVLKWENKKEVELFNSFDIGIMPLPNNEWTMGKCGMKGLLYMSVGIPTVISAVGMNKDIIEDGVDGFLPFGESQWFEVLTKLIDSPELRKKIGAKGREKVVDKYSKESTKDLYLDLYQSLMN